MSLHSKLAFCKNLPISCIVVSWTKTWVACEYIQSTHWLATGYFIAKAWKNRIWWRILRRRTCELGRFPVRMPVGLRQMAWVQLSTKNSDAKLYSRLDHNGHNLCKTVCMDVRLLLYSFCVFSEQWSLGSLYTCIRWSRLMSRGPHRAGIRAILTVGSLS